MNSWLWEGDGLKLLVDPILVDNLDFGIPWLYDAAKKFLKNFQVFLLAIFLFVPFVMYIVKDVPHHPVMTCSPLK